MVHRSAAVSAAPAETPVGMKTVMVVRNFVSGEVPVDLYMISALIHSMYAVCQ